MDIQGKELRYSAILSISQWEDFDGVRRPGESDDDKFYHLHDGYYLTDIPPLYALHELSGEATNFGDLLPSA